MIASNLIWPWKHFLKYFSLLTVISWIQNYQHKPWYHKKEKKLYLKYFPNRHTNTYTFLTCVISINNSWFVKYFCFFIFQTIIWLFSLSKVVASLNMFTAPWILDPWFSLSWRDSQGLAISGTGMRSLLSSSSLID